MKLTKRIKSIPQTVVLGWRWMRATPVPRTDGGDESVHGLARCDVVFINLDRRDDRRRHIEAEFAKIGVEHYTRFSAVSDENGALGCAKSHFEALSQWQPEANRMLMICEDDCTFQSDRPELDRLVDTFFKDERLAVLSLAYNARNSFGIGKGLNITSNTQTASCYVVKPSVIDDLLKSSAQSIRMLEQGLPEGVAAVDQTWKDVQRKVFFAIPKRRAAYQAPSYSDIEKKAVNYKL